MTFVIFILLLSGLVLIHEIGHFLAARIFGVKVEEFGIGIPPKAKSLFYSKGTEFTLNWLPLGGFVRLKGEQRPKSLKILKYGKQNSNFYAKPKWQRAIILSSGVIFNLLLGIVLFSVVFSFTGVPKVVGERVVVAGVSSGSPADISGLVPGDVVVRLGDEDINDVDEFIAAINSRRGSVVRLYVGSLEQDGTISDISREVSLIPRENPPEGEGALGVSIANVEIYEYDHKPWYLAPFYGVVVGAQEAFFWGKAVVDSLVKMIVGLFSGVVPVGVSGPVGIYQISQEVQKSGLVAFLRFSAILSINLGIFNLLPIPALDGGRLLFLVFEKIFGVKRIVKIESWVHGIGFIFLIGLLLLVTWQDILRLIQK